MIVWGRAVRAVVLALFLCVAATAAFAGARRPRDSAPAPVRMYAPSAHDHELVLERLERVDERSYAGLLRAYDEYLERHPGDAIAAVERCRFIEDARFDAALHDYNPNLEAYEQCLEELEERFPGAPPVALASLENTWGEEAIERARSLADEGLERWTPEAAARLYRHMATQLELQGDLEEAALAAQEAMRRDPSLDLTLTLARAWRARGDEESALRTLEAFVEAPAETWELAQKAELLTDLGDHDLAVRVYRRLAEDPDAQPDRFQYARALEGAGDLARARDQYTAAVDEHWDAREARRRLFLFDLTHREGWAAATSYEHLRDTGFGADPLLRYRLGLAWKHPSTRWRWRDAWAALLLLGIALGVAAAPALWILPVHYVGLLRRVRHPERERTATRWGLRHCWYASAWILLVDCAALYAYYYDDLDRFLEVTFSLDAGDVPRLAQMAVVVWGATILGLLPLLRRSDYRLLMRTRWSARRTVLSTLAALLVLWLTLALPLHLLARELAAPESAVTAILPAASSVTVRVVEAVGTTYGLVAQVGFVVILVPLYEELVFRGVLLEGCRRYLSFGWANGIQAGLFTVSHESLVHYPLYLALGLVAGVFARRSGGLAAPALLHVTNNAVALGLARVWLGS